ncbi:LLM class F420-dependent oxidoreductase [Micromonospora rosaria]|uniref:LLM class F420-dependent oxidoreductase n=1 Tax=Micromonospora rosaria TaxID=47874 RepID=A0A136PXK1_9ACTN|nr:LLM class F420-dependent oxidoreductase [Micromonospora rosaria]KXK63103.1 LLM class F420-dependent oxidoreductase [Micromonospora rosaria]
MTTTRGLRIALQLQPQHAEYARIRETVARAEELGVDVLFTWDHFFPLDGDPAGRHFECWTMLAAWAEATSRMELGPLVSCTGYRNPDLLADMARTVDHVSGGRVILGLGSGWYDRDFTEYGYELTTPAERLDDLTRALPRIEARLAALNPPPVRRMPVLIGGGGERRTLRLVARHADIWHSFGDPDTLRQKADVLRRHCAAVGRDPAEIEISGSVGGGPSPAGEPDDLGPKLRDLGVTLFTLGVDGPDYDLTLLRRWLAWRDAQ